MSIIQLGRRHHLVDFDPLASGSIGVTMVTYDATASYGSSGSYADTGLRGPVPRDARLIALILSSMGVSDVEPAVLLQLLEFAHRYTYDVLSDALVYSDHANSRQAGSNLSLDDVNLAIQSRVNYSFTKPPEKDVSTIGCLELLSADRGNQWCCRS